MELLFRAWDGLRMTKSGIMFNTSTGRLEVPKELTGSECVLKQPYILMQGAGIISIEGINLFEGDIVKDKYGRVLEIVRHNFRLQFKSHDPKNNFRYADFESWCMFDGESYTKECLVTYLGNIYKHPHLLNP